MQSAALLGEERRSTHRPASWDRHRVQRRVQRTHSPGHGNQLW